MAALASARNADAKLSIVADRGACVVKADTELLTQRVLVRDWFGLAGPEERIEVRAADAHPSGSDADRRKLATVNQVAQGLLDSA